MSEHTKHEHSHGTAGMTRWVHQHRRLARWIIKFLVAGVSALLFYLRRQEKVIEQEVRHDK